MVNLAICRTPSRVLCTPKNPVECTNIQSGSPTILLNCSSRKPLQLSGRGSLNNVNSKKMTDSPE